MKQSNKRNSGKGHRLIPHQLLDQGKDQGETQSQQPLRIWNGKRICPMPQPLLGHKYLPPAVHVMHLALVHTKLRSNMMLSLGLSE